MKPRFQADADFNEIILKAVLRREPTLDFQTATTAHLEGIDDARVLSLTARESRILVTHDRRTIPQHFATFVQTQTSSGVIIVSKKLAIQQVVDDLILIWFATQASEWENRIVILPI